MSTPLTPHVCPAVRQVSAREWQLSRAFTYTDRRPDGAVPITIPGGFVFDFASVPRVFWTLVASPTELRTCAPLVHDWSYRHGGVLPGVARPYSRAETDALFREIMAAHGVPHWRRWACYTAVRLGGGAAWNA